MNFAIDDDTGDLQVVDGEVQIVTDVEAVRQFLKQKLKTILNTHFLDLSLGLDYLGLVLVKNPNLDVITTIFVNEIVTTPGIISLDEFDMNFDTVNRELSLAFTAQTKDGEIQFNEAIP